MNINQYFMVDNKDENDIYDILIVAYKIISQNEFDNILSENKNRNEFYN